MASVKASRWALWAFGVSGVLLVGCGGGPDRLERDHFQGAKRFEFGNFVVVEVSSAIPASYEWSYYNVNGDAFHVPFERVMIRSRAGRWIVTDQGVGNQQIIVNGRRYPVPTHQLMEINNEGGRIQVRDDPHGGHSKIPLPIRESDLPHRQ